MAVCCEASVEYTDVTAGHTYRVLHTAKLQMACASNLFMNWPSALQQFVEMSAILRGLVHFNNLLICQPFCEA
jgi:hypothetical protein